MAKSLKGNYTSIELSGGIRMDLRSIEMKHVDMFAVNGNRGLLTVAMQRGGKHLVDRVKEEIQRQGLVDSGELYNSIRITDMDNHIHEGVNMSVGTDVYYARWVNDGTPAVIMAKGTRGLHVGGSRIMLGKPTEKWGDYWAGPSVKGQKASKFFEAALKAAEISDFTRR